MSKKENMEKVLNAIKEFGGPITITDISDLLDMRYGTVWGYMKELEDCYPGLHKTKDGYVYYDPGKIDSNIKPNKNAEGYTDNTAATAIKNVDGGLYPGVIWDVESAAGMKYWNLIIAKTNQMVTVIPVCEAGHEPVPNPCYPFSWNGKPFFADPRQIMTLKQSAFKKQHPVKQYTSLKIDEVLQYVGGYLNCYTYYAEDKNLNKKLNELDEANQELINRNISLTSEAYHWKMKCQDIELALYREFLDRIAPLPRQKTYSYYKSKEEPRIGREN